MTVYVGFEIEVEDDKKYYNKHDRPVYKLLDSSYPITGLETSGGIQDYHTGYYKSSQGEWRVEHDSSLRFGAEFIMPPLEKNIGLRALEDFFSLIEKSGCITSVRCGLHLNISGNNKTLTDANIGYFLSNINFRLLSKLWPNRVNTYNPYCTGISKILRNIAENKSIYIGYYSPPGINATLTTLQNQLLKGHNYMVNIRSIEDNDSRFEIRTMGGEDYHKEIEKIKATTNMFAKLLEKSENIEPEHINKRIVSYINRINKKRDSLNNVWIPPRIPTRISIGRLENNLKTIKHIHKQEFTPFFRQLNIYYVNLEHIENEKYVNLLYTNSNKYCSIISSIARQSLIGLYSDGIDVSATVRLVNEAIYHIIKYVDNNTNNSGVPSIALIKEYMTKEYNICGTPTKLTIPNEEQQKDIIWLSKYMYLFDIETRQNYVDRLSNHTLKFMNKYKKKYGKHITRMIQKKIKAIGE